MTSNPPGPPAGDGSFTVATFNIHHGAPARGWARLDRVAGTVAGLDADLVALQEVERRVRRSFWRNQASSVASRTGHFPLFAPAIRYRTGWFGNAVLCRSEITDVEVFALPRSPGREARCAIVGRTVLNGTPVSFAATHLANPKRSDPGRSEARRQLEVILHAVGRRSGAHLIMGDFNLGPEHVEPILDSAGYTTAPTGPTFSARSPRQRIDWVAVRGLRVIESRAAYSAVSDHLPVVTRLAPEIPTLPDDSA